jgi:hypothetical protein
MVEENETTEPESPATLTPVVNSRQTKAKPGRKTNWVPRITKSWGSVLSHMTKTAAAIIECGDVLVAAHADMDPDDFTHMIRNELPFGQDKAWALIKIAEHPLIREHTDRLPIHWTVLGLLAKLTEGEFLSLVNAGTISPDMTAKDLIARKTVNDADNTDDSDDDDDGESAMTKMKATTTAAIRASAQVAARRVREQARRLTRDRLSLARGRSRKVSSTQLSSFTSGTAKAESSTSMSLTGLSAQSLASCCHQAARQFSRVFATPTS